MWTRRAFVSTGLTAVVAAKVGAKGVAMAEYIFIGGTAKGEGEGIHVAKWDANAGTLSGLRLAIDVIQPSFMVAAEKAGQWLLFSGHQLSPTEAALSSFRITASGDLQLVNTVKVPDEEESFIQLALDKTNRCLVSASYRTSKVRSFEVGADGHLSEPVSEFQLAGSGPNSKRQTTAHAHGAVVAPGNNFALINDLGSDKIMVYKLNPLTAKMTPNDPPFYSAAPGSGPRHLAFHPNGKWAYSINELDSTLTLLAWDGVKGTLKKLDVTQTLPPDADVSKNRAGEVIIDKAGRILYACNRGPSEELLVYSISADGRLSLVERTPLGGKEARHFAIDPSGNFVVVAVQASDQVSVFSRNQQSGELKATGRTYPANKASCVVFV
jgi:6-phosphogluconolactonase